MSLPHRDMPDRAETAEVFGSPALLGAETRPEGNGALTPSEFKSYMQLAALFDGGAYARVIRLNREIQALKPFPRRTVIKEWNGGNVRFKHQPKSGGTEYLAPEDVFHFRAPVSLDGLNGLGLLDVAADTIGLAHLAEKAVTNLLRKEDQGHLADAAE